MIRISVIYMASGFGKRFGRNKLLEEIQGKKLYLYGLERLVEWQNIEARKSVRCLEIKIVLVSQYQEILETGKAMGLVCVKNDQAEEGITASIRLGLGAAGEADYYMFSVADQPWLLRKTIEDFIWKFLDVSDRYSIGCLGTEKGRGGNPAVFHRRYREELSALKGDKGGSQVIKRYPEEVFWYLAEEGQMKDIDRFSDIRE